MPLTNQQIKDLREIATSGTTLAEKSELVKAVCTAALNARKPVAATGR